MMRLGSEMCAESEEGLDGSNWQTVAIATYIAVLPRLQKNAFVYTLDSENVERLSQKLILFNDYVVFKPPTG
jgi:hypothetical protein